MAEPDRHGAEVGLLDVRSAAALVGRHPETVRRWVWSGQVPARRRGNRLLIARADLEAAAAPRDAVSLAGWADRARAARVASGTDGSGGSAAELVIEDRVQR